MSPAFSKLTTVRSNFEPPEEGKTGDLRRLAMTLIVSGEYANVRRFIHQLETAPEFLVLESVSVMTSEDRALNVTARVATYYRASDNGN